MDKKNILFFELVFTFVVSCSSLNKHGKDMLILTIKVSSFHPWDK